MTGPGSASAQEVLERELDYYNRFYDAEAVAHFFKPAVVAFRCYLVQRILASLGLGAQSRVLSIGCGIGDTELLLAPHVGSITGVDLSRRAIENAQRLAGERGIRNIHFLAEPWQGQTLAGPFDAVLAIFFLHHLSDSELAEFPSRVRPLLDQGGAVYAIDPSAHRLSGFLGRIFVPRLMKKYQTADERQLIPGAVERPFRDAGFDARTRWFDMFSTPLAGLFPAWEAGYRVCRRLDHWLIAAPGLRQVSSNFELIARVRPGT